MLIDANGGHQSLTRAEINIHLYSPNIWKYHSSAKSLSLFFLLLMQRKAFDVTICFDELLKTRAKKNTETLTSYTVFLSHTAGHVCLNTICHQN